ncbi:MAG: hypothetical protein AB7N24_23590 [Dehalococcoidia bacterium]
MATIVFAVVLVAIGHQLTTYDRERTHIPGHWLYWALMFAPSLVQLAYVIPAWRAARRHQRTTIARGVAVGATVVALVNVAVIGLLTWLAIGMARFD